MKTELKKILEKESAEQAAADNSRRDFIKKAAMGGVALGGMMNASIEDTIDYTTQRVSRASSPADLRITDLRMAGRIIKLYTNQGIFGYGEVRDGGDPRYALILKSRIVGLNPCNVEMIFKIIKQFGYHARQGGGVCGVEMALWDLCGKAYNVPTWQLLGGRYRDKIRLYADTPARTTGAEMAAAMKQRMEVEGYTWLKMDFSIRQAKDYDTQVVNNKFWSTAREREENIPAYMSYNNTNHPFTQIQLTDRALEGIVEYVEMVRNGAGYEIPLASDHYGHFGINDHIRMGRALEKYRLAWLEDVTQWWRFDELRTIKNALETPICTGEDIYCLKGPGLGIGFKDLIDAKCVDIIHPDLATSGGLLETKRISDYALENGVAAAFHQAGTPVTFMANVHCAAASENFLALEHHATNDPNWEKTVRMTGSKPIIIKGFADIPLDSPGLGIELIDEAIKEYHMPRYEADYGPMWGPTDSWNNRNSNDRIWS